MVIIWRNIIISGSHREARASRSVRKVGGRDELYKSDYNIITILGCVKTRGVISHFKLI